MESPNIGSDLSDSRFTCPYPGCQAHYRRKAHLRRHQAQHLPQEPLRCSECGKEFGRSDTLRRHVRREHHCPIEPGRRPRKACVNCRAMKLRCQGQSPCNECRNRAIDCVYDSRGPSNTSSPGNTGPAGFQSSTPGESPRSPIRSQEPEPNAKYIDTYFKLFHPQWPFIHKPSFETKIDDPLLRPATTAIGLWLTGNPSARSAAIELHGLLDRNLRLQRDRWDVSQNEEVCSSCVWPITMYQAILLHIILALMHRWPQNPLAPDLKPSLRAADEELLEALVRSCRKLGMFRFPNILAQFEADSGTVTFRWICVEEIKRFNIALFKICRATSRNQGDRDGYTSADIMRARDLEFPMPRNDPLWNAEEKQQWYEAAADEDFDNFGQDICHSEWISQSAGLLHLLL